MYTSLLAGCAGVVLLALAKASTAASATEESLAQASKQAHNNTKSLAQSPPTPAELEASCPSAYTACVADPTCAGLIEAPTTRQQSPLFATLVQCFNKSPMGDARLVAMAEDRSRLHRASEDIKCELCT